MPRREWKGPAYIFQQHVYSVHCRAVSNVDLVGHACFHDERCSDLVRLPIDVECYHLHTSWSALSFSNLWGTWVGYHSQEDLAEFGNRSERKVEKFRNYAIFLRHGTTYCLNMGTLSFLPHNVATVGHLFHQKNLCTCSKDFCFCPR